jgi:hypothetical protein
MGLMGMFQKSCGCDAKGGKDGCAQKDGCKGACQKDGCAQKDGCKGACQKSCRSPLFSLNLAQKGCCDSKGGKDGCAQKDGCCQKDSCAQKGGKGSCGPSLLERIFSCNQLGSCKSSKGGKGDCCDGKGDKGDKSVDVNADAPVPPAPVVDPSAYLNSQRRVVHASTSLVR